MKRIDLGMAFVVLMASLLANARVSPVPPLNFESLSPQKSAGRAAAALLAALLATSLPTGGARANLLDDIFSFFGGGHQGRSSEDSPKIHRSGDMGRRQHGGKAYSVGGASSNGRCMRACDGSSSPRPAPGEAPPKGAEKLCPCQMTVGADGLVRAEDFLTDPTLRSGDVVVTTDGVRIYRGEGREFSSLAQISDIPKEKRSALAAIDRLLERTSQAAAH